MCNPDCKQHSYTGVSEGDVFLLALVGRICPCVQHEVQYPLLNSLVALYFSNTQSWNSSQSSLMFPPMDFLNELKRKKINKKKEKKRKEFRISPPSPHVPSVVQDVRICERWSFFPFSLRPHSSAPVDGVVGHLWSRLKVIAGTLFCLPLGTLAVIHDGLSVLIRVRIFTARQL